MIFSWEWAKATRKIMADIARISYGYRTDIARIPCCADIVRISYGRTGDVRGMYRGCTGDIRLDIVRIPVEYAISWQKLAEANRKINVKSDQGSPRMT